ncbi:MAG: DUF1499 domain-containing protein [Deltaproteobacteria bacterium]|nr:DUF1499 domain-containing protein [Deltaproteobacteria bacterium]
MPIAAAKAKARGLARVAGTVAVVLVAAGCPGTRPANLGATNGALAPCPASPNCVNDRATDDTHKIAPLTYAGARADAMDKLAALVEGTPRARIVSRTDDYLNAEYTSLVWRFVDDVEFLFDADGRTIHVRSASRVGYGDMGVNRKRVEDVRERLAKP